MKQWKKIAACIVLSMGLILSAMGTMVPPGQAEAAEQPAGYLAVYVAAYENNMGVEHAQFPSGTYTDTCRTDVLYYGLSKDGVHFEGLNNDKAVYYPKGFHSLGSPVIFRKADGGYGLLASVNNAKDQIFLCDSRDLITFQNERVLALNNKGIIVKNPMVQYEPADRVYRIYWEGGDENSYLTTTEDFSAFSEPEITEYQKEEVTADLPAYAQKEEAAIFKLNQEEYDRIHKKYGKIESVAVHGAGDQVIKEGEQIDLPKQVEVEYSDGSVAKMGVDWELSNIDFDLEHLREGTYQIQGTVKSGTYHSPLARFRADPFVAYNEQDGMYYLTGSNLNERSAAGGGAYNTIVLRKADSINGLTDAGEVDIWTNKTVQMSDNRKDVITGWYWAPELHYIGGKWRIIAMATVKSTVDGATKNDGWAQCIFTCEGDDLMDKNNWKYDGYIGETTDNQKVGAFDTTFFEYDGQCYYVTPRDTKIFITTVDPEDLTMPTGPRVQISGPDRAFERNLGSKQDIEEGPGVLLHDGRIFVTYSCATVDMHYGVCLVYADLKDDLMNPDSWHKYQTPLLTTADLTSTVKQGVFTKDTTEDGEYKGVFGPGHNSFTVDENGNSVIVYHARDWEDSYPGATGDNKYGLTDPGRHAYANSVHFGADGFPIFNMTPQQILSDDLKHITMTIQVKSGKEETVSTAAPSPKTENPVVLTPRDTAVPTDHGYHAKKGKIYTVGKNKYRVKSETKKQVSFVGLKKKNSRSLTIPSSVKIGGQVYSVIEIEKKACMNCKRLRRITIQCKKLKKVGAKAFKGISKKAVVKVPKGKYKKYKKMLLGKGLPAKAEIS
ncbi:MAG: family 43 glycosylhydrolase [Eubacterium sp.]|nr:family 43 glycosylhydrolase [Eubacterium sp.]